jgi:hypothetical protein
VSVVMAGAPVVEIPRRRVGSRGGLAHAASMTRHVPSARRSSGTVPSFYLTVNLFSKERCCQLRKKSAAGVTVAELDLFSNRPVP